MDNQLPVPINYLVILLVEIAAFSIFVYLVFSKTSGELCRRWKASVFVSVTFGIFIQTIYFCLGWVGWLIKVNLATFYENLIEYLNILIPASLGMASMIIMPIIILGTFIAYYRFASSGDRLIEKYWRNPKVHYGKDQKPYHLNNSGEVRQARMTIPN